MQIKISAGTIAALAALNDSFTARKIAAILPIKSTVNLWGDEIYFTIPLHCELENEQKIVNMGDLGFWPEGDTFCIFFGPTPISKRDEIRPASSVNVFGRIIGDAKAFKQIHAGTEITVEELI